MRAACRKLLDTVQAGGDEIVTFANQPNHYASWIFMGALGELRGLFGIHLAKFASQYGLDGEDDFAAILPASALGAIPQPT